MAEQDVVIGKYYFRRGAYIAAIQRARHVIENYPHAPANLDALKLMERAYGKLELADLSADTRRVRSEEHTSELQSRGHLVCRLLLEKKKNNRTDSLTPTGGR